MAWGLHDSLVTLSALVVRWFRVYTTPARKSQFLVSQDPEALGRRAGVAKLFSNSHCFTKTPCCIVWGKSP